MVEKLGRSVATNCQQRWSKKYLNSGEGQMRFCDFYGKLIGLVLGQDFDKFQGRLNLITMSLCFSEQECIFCRCQLL